MQSILLKLLFTTLYFTSIASAKTDLENYLSEIEISSPQSGMDCVDCIYVINLENRPANWLEIKDAFEVYGIQPNRMNAINGWFLSEEDKQTLSGNYPIRLRGGQMGCMLSHLSILNDAKKKGYDIVWVCEDDIKICENPHRISSLIETLSKIDNEWDIFYTDPNTKNSDGVIIPSLSSDFRPDVPHKRVSYYRKRFTVGPEILKINQRFGCYSMLISKRGIEKILNYFNTMYFWTAYDIDIHYIPYIRQYCIKKDFVTVNQKEQSDTTDFIE